MSEKRRNKTVKRMKRKEKKVRRNKEQNYRILNDSSLFKPVNSID